MVESHLYMLANAYSFISHIEDCNNNNHTKYLHNVFFTSIQLSRELYISISEETHVHIYVKRKNEEYEYEYEEAMPCLSVEAYKCCQHFSLASSLSSTPPFDENEVGH